MAVDYTRLIQLARDSLKADIPGFYWSMIEGKVDQYITDLITKATSNGFTIDDTWAGKVGDQLPPVLKPETD